MSFEDISVVIMDLFGSDQRGLPRVDAGGKAAFQHGSLVPGDRMQGKVSDPGTLRREGELLQYREGVRQHLRPGEIRKPKTEIKRIGQNHLVAPQRAASTSLNCSRIGGKETVAGEPGSHSSIIDLYRRQECDRAMPRFDRVASAC